jgi:hypothetical protein
MSKKLVKTGLAAGLIAATLAIYGVTAMMWYGMPATIPAMPVSMPMMGYGMMGYGMPHGMYGMYQYPGYSAQPGQDQSELNGTYSNQPHPIPTMYPQNNPNIYQNGYWHCPMMGW